jgi:hypothetical protein
LQGQPETVETPSNSGKGQKIVRCPDCRVALWSHYAGTRRCRPGISITAAVEEM